ncbi:MAG: hypothetical protein ACK5PS_14620 [Desulfopila sp.]
MDKQQSLVLKKYVDLLFRWRLLLISLLLLALPAALVFYIFTPKLYEATSLLSYEEQSISPNKMAPDLSSKLLDTVSTLTQIVTSKTNLEQFVTSFDLYREARAKFPMEDVIELMRKNIDIQPSRRGDIFSISYSGENPATVARVTNAIAAKFIEENLKYRQEKANETFSYTSNELEMAKATMDSKEATMRDYKLKYYNEMPDQRQANLSRLTSLQEQYQGQLVSILELERNKTMLQDQITAQKKTIEALEAQYGAAAGSTTAGSSRYDQLRAMQRNLEVLKATHTESHPEIKRVRKIIAQLKAEASRAPSSGSGSSAPPDGTSDAVRGLQQLETQFTKLNIDIEALELEKKQTSNSIGQYEKWIAATPVREAEWSALTREYGQLKNHYDYLVAQDLQAKSMLNLERRQKGSQFKIVDVARTPEKPTKPDFIKLMAVAVAGALALGVGIVLVINFLDGSFRDPEDAELFLGIPVLTTIPLITTPMEQRKNLYVSSGLLAVVVTGTVLVVGLFWYAWSRGKIVL